MYQLLTYNYKERSCFYFIIKYYSKNVNIVFPLVWLLVREGKHSDIMCSLPVPGPTWPLQDQIIVEASASHQTGLQQYPLIQRPQYQVS